MHPTGKAIDLTILKTTNMRQVTKLLALLAVVLLTTVSAKAYDFAVDGIYYKSHLRNSATVM